MRVQEHLFQGFFGINKKKDAGKYYHERVDKLKGIDNVLDSGIEQFQKILSNHNRKLSAYYEFLKKFDKESLQALREEIKHLEGMFDVDDVANREEERYMVKIENVLKELIANEESNELSGMEKDVVQDLKSLQQLLASIGPLWQQQIEFIKKNDEEIFGSKPNIKVLSDVFKEEGDIMLMEESLLKKIDLKSGAILRKTTLKMRGIEKTKDMNMEYRQIQHIR